MLTVEEGAAMTERVDYLRQTSAMYFTIMKDIAALQDAVDEANERLHRVTLVTDGFAQAAWLDDPVVASDGYTYNGAELRALLQHQPAVATTRTTTTADPITSRPPPRSGSIGGGGGGGAGDSSAATSSSSGTTEEGGEASTATTVSAPLPVVSHMTAEVLAPSVAYPNRHLKTLVRRLQACIYGPASLSATAAGSTTSVSGEAA